MSNHQVRHSELQTEGTPTFYWYRKGKDFKNRNLRLLMNCSVGTVLGSIIGYLLVRPIAHPTADKAIVALAIFAISVVAFCIFKMTLAGERCLMTASEMKHFVFDINKRQIYATNGSFNKPIELFSDGYSEIDLDKKNCSVFACGNPNIPLIWALEHGDYAHARNYKDYAVRIELSRNNFDALEEAMAQ